MSRCNIPSLCPELPQKLMIHQLRYVPVSDSQPDLGRIGDHADNVSVNAAIDRLGNQRLEPRADLPRRQVPGGRDEFDPEGHGSLTTVAQLQHGTTRDRTIVDVAKYAHLIEVKYHFELRRRQHLPYNDDIPNI